MLHIPRNGDISTPATRPSSSVPSPSLPRTEPNYGAIIWLIGTSGMLLGAWLMTVGDQRRVLLPWLKLTLPETCTARLQFGIDCPGCGLTRSFIHIAHGNLAAAWQLQPLSLAIFTYTALQIPLAICHLRRVQPDWLATSTRWNSRVLIALVVALGLRWVWRLSTGDLF